MIHPGNAMCRTHPGALQGPTKIRFSRCFCETGPTWWDAVYQLEWGQGANRSISMRNKTLTFNGLAWNFSVNYQSDNQVH